MKTHLSISLCLYCVLVGAFCGCSKQEGAAAVKQPDPEITQIATNEVASIDFREKLKENRAKQITAAEMDELTASIQMFQSDLGRVPSNLVELVEMRYIDKIPAAPPGRVYEYEAKFGQIQILQSRGAAAEEKKKDSRKSATFIGQ